MQHMAALLKDVLQHGVAHGQACTIIWRLQFQSPFTCNMHINNMLHVEAGPFYRHAVRGAYVAKRWTVFRHDTAMVCMTTAVPKAQITC